METLFSFNGGPFQARTIRKSWCSRLLPSPSGILLRDPEKTQLIKECIYITGNDIIYFSCLSLSGLFVSTIPSR